MDPVYGDRLDAPVAWRTGGDLSGLRDNPVRLRVVPAGRGSVRSPAGSVTRASGSPHSPGVICRARRPDVRAARTGLLSGLRTTTGEPPPTNPPRRENEKGRKQCPTCRPFRSNPSETVRKDDNHNAFTDLCAWSGRFYLTFRSSPDGHRVSSSAWVRRPSERRRPDLVGGIRVFRPGTRHPRPPLPRFPGIAVRLHRHLGCCTRRAFP